MPGWFKGDSVEFLQSVYRNPEFDMATRISAARDAAAFERPKLSQSTVDESVTHIVRMPRPMKTVEDWASRGLEGGRPYGTRPIITFARASYVTRPAPSAGNRACVRVFTTSISSGGSEATTLPALPLCEMFQNSSKSVNVR